MGYLDNSSITVDAILTKKGRELLAQGRNAFNITQFALADDEVDYDLWNPSDTRGSAYYGSIIENMPLTEALPDETQVMKYKLITLPANTESIPQLKNNFSSYTFTRNGAFTFPITPFVDGFTSANQKLGYTVTLADSTYLDLQVASTSTIVASGSQSIGDVNVSGAKTKSLVGLSFNLVRIGAVPNVNNTEGSIQLQATTITIVGNETGGNLVIPVTVNS
jgi:hypothetical protein